MSSHVSLASSMQLEFAGWNVNVKQEKSTVKHEMRNGNKKRQASNKEIQVTKVTPVFIEKCYPYQPVCNRL